MLRKSSLFLSVISVALFVSAGYLLLEKNELVNEIHSFHQSKFDHAIGSLKNGTDALQKENWIDAETNIRVAEEDIRLLGDDFNYGRTQTHVSTLPMSHLLGLYAQEIHEWEVNHNPQNASIVTSDLQSLVQRAEKENWGNLDFESLQNRWNQSMTSLKDRQVLDIYEKGNP